MKRKEVLKKREMRLQNKIADARAKAQASEDVAEVRSLTAQIEDLALDLEEVRAELAAIEAEENAPAPEDRSAVPAGAQLVNGGVVGTFPAPEQRDAETPWNGTMEYRKAFMAYIQKGVAIPQDLIPAEVRAGEATSTAEVGAAIPITVMNEVINTVRLRYGNLYNKVRKLNMKGGVKFPVGALRAKLHWVGEKTVAPKQKAGELGDVSFYYNVGEIKISRTFLASITTIDAFEAAVAEAIAVAFLEAMDDAIVNGSGDNAPLGILNDPRVTNVVEMTEAEFTNWTKWKTKFFKQIPMGYRAGEFIFAMSTCDLLETMQDSNGRPIYREATGLEMSSADNSLPTGRFFGRTVNPVEPDILPDFQDAAVGDVVGIFFQPLEYAFNENYAFTMRRYFDEDENEVVDKALIVTDGKTLNPTGFYKIVKK